MMEMKNRTLLLSGAVLLAAMSSLEVAHGAVARQNLLCNLGDQATRNKISTQLKSQFLKFITVPGSTGDEVCLKLVMTQKPSRDVELTLAIPGEISGKRVVLADDAFAGLDSPKLQLHLIIGEEHGKKVKMPMDCSAMFNKSTSIWSIQFRSVDTSQTMIMTNMFNGLKNLRQLHMWTFDTSNVINTNGMFKGCDKLPCVNISAFGDQHRTPLNIYYMFNGYTPQPTDKKKMNQQEKKIRKWLSNNRHRISTQKLYYQLQEQYEEDHKEYPILPKNEISAIDWEKEENEYKKLTAQHNQAQQDKFFQKLAREEPEGIPSDEESDKRDEIKLEIDLNDENQQPALDENELKKKDELSIQEVLERSDEEEDKTEINKDNQAVNKTEPNDEEDNKVENTIVDKPENHEIHINEQGNTELQLRNIQENHIDTEEPQAHKFENAEENEVSTTESQKTTGENKEKDDNQQAQNIKRANNPSNIAEENKPKTENNKQARIINDDHNKVIKIEQRPQGFYERWIRPIIRRVVAAASQTMSALSRIGATVRGWF